MRLTQSGMVPVEEETSETNTTQNHDGINESQQNNGFWRYFFF